MAEDQELRFVCKLCFKKYPCGKSLGGHMRSHVVANSAESDEKLEQFMKKNSSFVSGGSDVDGSMNDPRIGELGNGQSTYVLRENPRKSWRAVDSNIPLPLGKICKQCGKGFNSLKALCGHMACHSEKDRGFKDDHSWTSSETQKLVMDSHSDTEGEDRVIRTRSCNSKKFKKVLVKPPSSSSMSEIDGEEQEEVAICLMMLSRDYGSKGVYSFVESSDNNSIILETKSSSIDMKRGFGKKIDHQDETPKFKKVLDVKSEDCVFDDGIGEMEDSDSGYFLDECAKAESDVSVDGHRRKAKKESKYDHRIDESRKRRYMVENSEFYEDYDKIKKSGDHEKRPKYECFNCKKSFKSYQALGGHRPCHKKSNTLGESRYESGENSLDEFAVRGKVVESVKPSGKSSSKGKKSKGHVCPFCDRVFKNGQALGGHKRSHFIGGHEVNNISKNNHNSVSKLDLLDLNLPAPQDEDDEGGNEQYSW